MAKILLKNINVLLPDSTVKIADVVVNNDVIEKIGQADVTAAYDRVIDGTDKLAAPGFVNTHTHASMTLLRSYADDMALKEWLEQSIWPVEAKMTPEDIYWGAMLAIAEMIKSGTTTFADMYGDMDQVAKAVCETGIRASLARGIIGVAPNGQQALKENIELFRNYNQAENGRITVMFGPHAPYTCPPDFLRQVAGEAGKLGAEVHIHLSETQGEVADCMTQYGKSPFAIMEETGILECGVLAAHSVHVSDDDIALMKKYNVRVAHNPGSNLKLASGIAPVTKMLAAGVCVGLGTDGTSSNNNLDMLEEVQLAALIHKTAANDPLAVPAATAVQMATEYGAKALGLKNNGLIQEGCKADITIFDMTGLKWQPRHNIVSLLAYSAGTDSVDTVMVDGKLLLDNGKLTTIDEQKVIAEVNQRAMRLTK